MCYIIHHNYQHHTCHCLYQGPGIAFSLISHWSVSSKYLFQVSLYVSPQLLIFILHYIYVYIHTKCTSIHIYVYIHMYLTIYMYTCIWYVRMYMHLSPMNCLPIRKSDSWHVKICNPRLLYVNEGRDNYAHSMVFLLQRCIL